MSKPAGKNWSQELLEASKKGDTELIRIAIREGADVNYKQWGGVTPLMHAAQSGNIETVILLLDNGADKNIKDSSGRTVASWAGDKKDIAQLIKDYGEAPNYWAQELFEAISHGDSDLERVKTILEKGVNINQLQNDLTPLMYAAIKGHHLVVEMLLDHGADKSFQNKDGKTASDLANEHHHKIIAKTISNFGEEEEVEYDSAKSEDEVEEEKQEEDTIEDVKEEEVESPTENGEIHEEEVVEIQENGAEDEVATARVIELENELRLLREKSDHMLDDLQQSIRELRKEKDDNQKAIQQHLAELHQVKQEFARQQQEINRYRQELERNTHELDAERKKNAILTGQLSQLDEIEAARKIEQVQAEQLQFEIKQCRGLLEAETAAKNIAQEDSIQWKIEAGTLSKRVVQLEQSANPLSEKNTALKQQLVSVEEKLMKSEQGRISLEKEIQNLKSQVSLFEHQSRELKANLNSVKKETVNPLDKRELDKLKQQNEQLRKEAEESMKYRHESSQEFEQLKREYDILIEKSKPQESGSATILGLGAVGAVAVFAGAFFMMKR